MDLSLFYTWCKTENYESHQSIHANSRHASKLVCKPSALIGSSSKNPMLSYQMRKTAQIKRGKRNRALFIFKQSEQMCEIARFVRENEYQILHLPVWVSNSSEIEYWYRVFKKINIITMVWTVLIFIFFKYPSFVLRRIAIFMFHLFNKWVLTGNSIPKLNIANLYLNNLKSILTFWPAVSHFSDTTDYNDFWWKKIAFHFTSI